MVFRDLNFINKIKMPSLYDKHITTWRKLNRLQKQNIIMHYVDNIELTYDTNKVIIYKLNFRPFFYTEFDKWFQEEYLDWTFDGEKFSNYLSKEEVK